VANRTRTLADAALEIAESYSIDAERAIALAVDEVTPRYGVICEQTRRLATAIVRATLKRANLGNEIAHVVERSENMRRQIEACSR
jgi:hypothetical protein